MDHFLETLKSRFLDAQKRQIAAQLNLAKAQNEFNLANQELAGWQIAIAAEERKLAPPASQPLQPPHSPQPSPTTIVIRASATPSATTSTEVKSEINKTQAVHQLLRQHPAGITPRDLWKEASGHLTNRTYLYSILKRLKDRDEITIRRGKYYPKVAPTNHAQEGSSQTGVIQ